MPTENEEFKLATYLGTEGLSDQDLEIVEVKLNTTKIEKIHQL